MQEITLIGGKMAIIEEALPWLLTAMSLYGTHLNAHGNKKCFRVWIVANFAYCLWFFSHGMMAQALLFAVFIHYNLIGMREWK